MRFPGKNYTKTNNKIKKQVRKGTALAFAIAVLAGTFNFGGVHTQAEVVNGLHATYFNNKDLTSPISTRIDDSISFDWGQGSPVAGVDPESFSVRWAGQVMPRYSENYSFFTVSDDGVRLWVNNQLIIDNWSDHGATENSGTIYLTANQKYDLKMEFYDNTINAVAKLSWASNRQSKEIVPKSQLFTDNSVAATVNSPIVAASTQGLLGSYYSDLNFSNLALTRTDSAVNFNWGNGSPAANFPSDVFTVRWAGNIQIPAPENYTFYTYSDDGVRLWVNGQQIVNNWTDHAGIENQGTVWLAAGSYPVKMEFYERYGNASAVLSWSSPSLGKQVIPQSALNSSSAAAISPAPAPAPTPTTVNSSNQPAANSSNPLSGVKFYVNPDSDAKHWADSHRSWDSYNASLMDKIANQPEAMWLGNWNANISADVSNYANKTSAAGAVPVFVVYNIPQRDCGGYSAGGVGSPDAYRTWTNAIASAIGNRKAVIVLEPDALALTDCLSQTDKQTRFQLIKDAITAYKSKGITVYVDAGHSGWIAAYDMASRLNSAGVASADGFALNTSNFVTTSDNINYGSQISSAAGNKHFIIDTGRNGQGPAANSEWCNPSGRGLGSAPTSNTGNALVDAFLWTKKPGESDGSCNGGPSAGVFWPDYALGLAQRAGW
ncbi:MAG: glycoside hydrolase family 6 protein [Acidobacteriaceae bacterium]